MGDGTWRYVTSTGDCGGGGSGGPGGGTGDSGPDGYGGAPHGPVSALTPNTVLVVSPDHPIVDIVQYLKCLNPTQGATMTVCARQPVPGTADTYKIGPNGKPDVGHTFLSITQNGITRVLGFYPTSDAAFLIDSQGIVGNNSQNGYTVSVSTLTASGLSNVLGYIQKNFNVTYFLSNFNCTGFAIGAAAAGGLILPSTPGQWGVIDSSLNPGTLGQQMSSIPLPPDAQRGGAGTAPANSGGC